MALSIQDQAVILAQRLWPRAEKLACSNRHAKKKTAGSA
jgi:hypothetical protein